MADTHTGPAYTGSYLKFQDSSSRAPSSFGLGVLAYDTIRLLPYSKVKLYLHFSLT